MQAPEIKNPHGVSARELLSHEHAQVMMVTLQPGEALKRHITPASRNKLGGSLLVLNVVQGIVALLLRGFRLALSAGTPPAEIG